MTLSKKQKEVVKLSEDAANVVAKMQKGWCIWSSPVIGEFLKKGVKVGTYIRTELFEEIKSHLEQVDSNETRTIYTLTPLGKEISI